MRRWSLGWALAVCAIAAAGCGGGSKSSAPPGGAAKGLKGQYYYLAVTPPTGGSIASSDGAIACQPSGAGCGDSVYHQTKFTWGTQVTLTATAAQGYVFQSWSGDCSGTTCTIGTTDATEYSVAAVFSPAAPLPATTVGRVYGYVKDGGVGVGGVKLTLGSLSATTNANGAYVFEIAPGSYTLQTASSTQYAASAGAAVTVPIPDGVADPAGSCYAGGAKQGYWVPTAGQAGAGCLVRQADIALTRASTYVAPAAAPVPVKTLAFGGIAGFGKTASLDCADATGTWKQVSGPTTVDPGTGSTFSFTTPDLATAFAALDPVKLAIVKDGRPSFLSINQAQAAALTYSFKCTTATGGSATVSVPLVAAVNANIATALRGEPFKMASYKGAANGLPGVTGPLWAAGAETYNSLMYPLASDPTKGTNPDGSAWRAHDAVQVPPGVIMILDGPPGAKWKFCAGSKDSFASCTSNADALTANAALVGGDGMAAAWFPVTWTVGKSVYLTSDQLSATNNGFAGEPNIPVATKIWGGWDQRNTAGVESCAGCHIAPGEKIAWDPTVCPGVPNDGVTPCYELGPTEPTTGWMESKHAKAVIDGGSSTHFTLEACGACHTTGWDRSLPASNVGFSAVLGSYTNDFLFEGSDATLWTADLAAKNPAAAALTNVQCGSCHGPTPNSPNHTASMSSKICGTCHNGHDPQYEQWASTAAVDPATSQPKHGHANLADAQGEGPNHGRDQTHCGRCHFAQGYMLYSQAIVSGNPDKLGNAAPVGAPTTALVTPLLCSDAAPNSPTTPSASTDSCPTTQATGLVTAQNIDAITCQTCHDPHSLEVRIKDADTANGMLLAGGFKIYNAGSGALCASCHNSRNGIVGATAPNLNKGTVSLGGTPMQHHDATPLTSANFGMTGPHSAAQADVYFAGNGYLLCNDNDASGACPMPTTANPHQNPTYFADTCAECHVKRLSTATKNTPSNHTFTVDEGTCAGCHGTGTTYIASREIVMNRMLPQYLTSLTNVLKGAGITSVTGNKVLPSAAAGAVTKAAGVSVVTVTQTNHGLASGATVVVAYAKADDSTQNPAGSFKPGSYKITVVDANSFTFDDKVVAASAAATSGATSLWLTGTYDVTNVALNAAAVTGDRPLTLDLTFATMVVASCNIDKIMSDTKPTLYTGTTTKTYGKVAKSMYDYALIENDNSKGVHNIPFVDAMLNAMVNNLDSPGLPK